MWEYTCYGIKSTSYYVCSRHGTCKNNNNCVCYTGYTGSDCSKYVCHGKSQDLSDVCSGRGVCVGKDTCECRTGYYGRECEFFDCFGIRKDNPESCGSHGECTNNDMCTCKHGYWGQFCNQTSCYGILGNDSSVCSEVGSCSSYNNCDCLVGYYSYDCSVTECFGYLSNFSEVCSSHGSCSSPGVCSCCSGYEPPNCSIWTCSGILWNETNVCSGHGSCEKFNTCVCSNSSGLEYYGKVCSVFRCFDILNNDSIVCSGHGICEEINSCKCVDGFTGIDCYYETNTKDSGGTEVVAAIFLFLCLCFLFSVLLFMAGIILFAIVYYIRRFVVSSDALERDNMEEESGDSELGQRNWTFFKTSMWKCLWISRNIVLSYSVFICLLVVFLFNLSNTITTAGVLRILEEPACYRSEIREPLNSLGAKFGFWVINMIDRFLHFGIHFLLIFIGSGIFYRLLQFLLFFIWDREMGFRNISEIWFIHLRRISGLCCFDCFKDNSCLRRIVGNLVVFLSHLYLEIVPLVVFFFLVIGVVAVDGNIMESVSGYVIAMAAVVLSFTILWYVFSIFSEVWKFFGAFFDLYRNPSRIGLDQEEYLRRRASLIFSIVSQRFPSNISRNCRVILYFAVGIFFCCVLSLAIPSCFLFLKKIFYGESGWMWLNFKFPFIRYMHFTAPIGMVIVGFVVSVFCLVGIYLKMVYLKKERVPPVRSTSAENCFSKLSLLFGDVLNLSTGEVVWTSFLLISLLITIGTVMFLFGRMYVLLGIFPLLLLNIICVFCCFIARFQYEKYGSFPFSVGTFLGRIGIINQESPGEIRDRKITSSLNDEEEDNEAPLEMQEHAITSNMDIEEKGEQLDLGVVVFSELSEVEDNNQEFDKTCLNKGVASDLECNSDNIHSDVKKSRCFPSIVDSPILFLMFSVVFWLVIFLVSTLVPSIPWTRTTFNPFSSLVFLILACVSGCGGLCDKTRITTLRMCYILVMVFVLLTFIFSAAYHDWRRGVFFPWPISGLEEWRKFERKPLASKGYYDGKLNWNPEYSYVGEDKFPMCDMSWNGLDIVDFLLFSELSYANERSEDFLRSYFPQCRSKEVCELIVPERQGDVTFFHVSAPSLGWHVISIRGTTDLVDFLQDAALWKETGLLQTVDIFVPVLKSLPRGMLRKIIWLWSILDVVTSGFLSFSERKAQNDGWWKWEWFNPALYHSDIVDYVIENINLENDEKLFVTGHSLGGGLSQAVVIGLNLVDEERFNSTSTLAFSFAGPGMVATSGKLLGLNFKDMSSDNRKIENMLATGIINITPDVDIVSNIDFLSGIVQNVGCPMKQEDSTFWKVNFGPTTCHSSFTILSSLLRGCGNQRNRSFVTVENGKG